MKTKPTQPAERVVSLDVLRGFAVLGILVMNIQNFSMPTAAYLNPTVYGNFEGLNKLVWMFSHLFAGMKFITIFSMLFGAGIVLFTERLKAKGIHSLALHYRRTGWLFVIGLAHAYLLWYGDILVNYAITALWVVMFRNMKPKKLLLFGLLFVSVASLLYVFSGLSIPFMDEASRQEMLESWHPPAEIVQQEIAKYRGDWLDQMPHRMEEALTMQTFVYFFKTGWRSGGVMLIGMVLFKWGVFSAAKSKKWYLKLAVISLFLGLAIVAFGMKTNLDAGFSLEYSFFLGFQYNYWGSLLVSMGYVGLIMLWVKSDFLNRLKSALQAIGRMALTNYLLQTIICTIIFYGHGFGLFGKVERTGQILIVFAVWIVMVIASPVWLKYFKYGPFEWLWRSLTYRRLQQFSK